MVDLPTMMVVYIPDNASVTADTVTSSAFWETQSLEKDSWTAFVYLGMFAH